MMNDICILGCAIGVIITAALLLVLIKK